MNVGLVGCGDISDCHMKAWSKIESARVTAVCDIIEERATRVGQKWNVPSCYTDLDTMIKRENLHFLSICTPPNVHTDAACNALESGVNTVVEKPLAMTVKEVERVQETSRHSKAKLTVISTLLFTSAIDRARRVLESMAQEIQSVDVHFLKTPDYHMAADPSHWCHGLPGGIFGESLFHAIYLIRTFIGDLQARGIYADKLGKYEWMRYDELTVFLSAPGKQATIRYSFNSPRSTTFLDLYGQGNVLRAELNTNDVCLFRDPQKRSIGKAFEGIRQASAAVENALCIVPDAVSFRLAIQPTIHELNIRSFVESVTSGKPPLMTLDDAYRITELQERITTLIDTHRPF
jgi:predicted dehydrogenase